MKKLKTKTVKKKICVIDGLEFDTPNNFGDFLLIGILGIALIILTPIWIIPYLMGRVFKSMAKKKTVEYKIKLCPKCNHSTIKSWFDNVMYCDRCGWDSEEDKYNWDNNYFTGNYFLFSSTSEGLEYLRSTMGNDFTCNIKSEKEIECIAKKVLRKKNPCQLYLEDTGEVREDCICEEEEIEEVKTVIGHTTDCEPYLNCDGRGNCIHYYSSCPKYEMVNKTTCLKARPKTFEDLNCKTLDNEFNTLINNQGNHDVNEKVIILKRMLELNCFEDDNSPPEITIENPKGTLYNYEVYPYYNITDNYHPIDIENCKTVECDCYVRNLGEWYSVICVI